jgi:hypothetical protein
MTRLQRLSLALGSLLVLSASHCDEADDLPRDRTIAIRGRLTDEADECPTMRDRDNRLYTLAGSTDLYKPGDRVCVKGRVVENSACHQGTTIAVDWIGPMRFCP